MIKIGITGSIGSGKSTLAKHASVELGIAVFDADQIVNDLYSDNDDLKTFIRNNCGDDFIQNNQVDRNKLKTILLDPKQIALWKSIEQEVHKLVWQQYELFVAQQIKAGASFIIADIPFLFETKSESYFDYSINVFLPYEQQKIRALNRQTPKLTSADFEKRYSVFMPIEQRNIRADFVVDNSGELEASVLQLRLCLAQMVDCHKIESEPLNYNTSAVYVGSFDPMTLGHVDVVKSAAKMPYPKLYVAIGINPNKKPMFTVDQRLAMIEREMDRDVRPFLGANQEVIVTAYEGLTVDFMESVGSSFCVRGLRGIKDLEEEGDLAAVNRGLFADSLTEPGVQSFSQAYFATTNPDLRHVSSSFARGICLNTNKDLSLLRYVSSDVAAKMIAKRDQINRAKNSYRTPTKQEVNQLELIWNALPIGDSLLANQIFLDLMNHYSESHRTYHNIGHLVELFEYFEQYKYKLNDPTSVAMALFFHDVIYDVSSSSNEKNSTIYARKALKKLNVDVKIIDRVEALINMTASHDVTDNDEDSKLFLDMDMAILGVSNTQYIKYCKAVECEYLSHYSIEQFKKGRKDFLSVFKEKDRVFLTDEFENTLGENVFVNIKSEYLKLQG
ncbi:dephospho-CoA kinase [Marinicellulosiphila megalodicopiae]|uniref:dephospho-CoA kinase n=1 Tax=Marinicellulosiphila megalodicopiae TaxID=2724896 RepID=UPI003BAF1E7C